MMRGWPPNRQKTVPANAVPRKLSMTPCICTHNINIPTRKQIEKGVRVCESVGDMAR